MRAQTTPSDALLAITADALTARLARGPVRLESVDPAHNRARFYELAWQPTLWGNAALVRRWGRIGTRGRERVFLYADDPGAEDALRRWASLRLRHGYRLAVDAT